MTQKKGWGPAWLYKEIVKPRRRPPVERKRNPYVQAGWSNVKTGILGVLAALGYSRYGTSTPHQILSLNDGLLYGLAVIVGLVGFLILLVQVRAMFRVIGVSRAACAVWALYVGLTALAGKGWVLYLEPCWVIATGLLAGTFAVWIIVWPPPEPEPQGAGSRRTLARPAKKIDVTVHPTRNSAWNRWFLSRSQGCFPAILPFWPALPGWFYLFMRTG
jgi:hypothetical protein